MLLAILLPDVSFHVAVEASRAPRPLLPAPHLVETNVTHPQALNDAEFPGWIRLGYVEREFVVDSKRIWRVPTSVAQVASGVRLVGAEKVDVDLRPFGDIDAAAWLRPATGASEPADAGVLGVATGPMCGATRIDDLLGTAIILTPSPHIAARAGLRLGPRLRRLCWIDSDAEEALVLRTWRVRALGYHRTGEIPMLQGCELLARPDVVHAVSARVGLRTVVITHAIQQAVPRLERGSSSGP
ncbi:MAG TPA: hypothetical protein VFK04_04960 [Gemmatimonadaceae bacterium]|nr:hypothetical protein [Gemmatimonadaceae bacterium]